jgi:hypothetical protein
MDRSGGLPTKYSFGVLMGKADYQPNIHSVYNTGQADYQPNIHSVYQ